MRSLIFRYAPMPSARHPPLPLIRPLGPDRQAGENRARLLSACAGMKPRTPGTRHRRQRRQLAFRGPPQERKDTGRKQQKRAAPGIAGAGHEDYCSGLTGCCGAHDVTLPQTRNRRRESDPCSIARRPAGAGCGAQPASQQRASRSCASAPSTITSAKLPGLRRWPSRMRTTPSISGASAVERATTPSAST